MIIEDCVSNLFEILVLILKDLKGTKEGRLLSIVICS